MAFRLQNLFAIVALFAVGACDDVPTPQMPAFLQSDKGPDTVLTASTPQALTKQAAIKVTLAQSGVTLVGPKGYCIDKTTTTRMSATLLPCAIFNEKATFVPEVVGALRLTTGPKSGVLDGLDATALESYLRSSEGRSVLSRSGNPASVAIEKTKLTKEAFYVRVLDASPSPYGKVNSAEWRAITELNGRLSVASSGGYGQIKLGDASGLNLLQEFVATLRTENSVTVSKKETNNPFNAVLSSLRK